MFKLGWLNLTPVAASLAPMANQKGEIYRLDLSCNDFEQRLLFVSSMAEETAHGFQIRRHEFNCGCRPTVYDTNFDTYLQVAGNSKSESFSPSHFHIYVEFTFIDLIIFS